jgi:hypothetical protein
MLRVVQRKGWRFAPAFIVAAEAATYKAPKRDSSLRSG